MIRNFYQNYFIWLISVGFAVLFVFNTRAASAQINNQNSQLPCNSFKEAPAYLKAFMGWALQKQNKQSVTVQADTAQDTALAVVQFDFFNLKTLNRFYTNRKKKKIAGRVNGYLEVSGTCKEPKITGKVTLSNGYVMLSNFGRQSLQTVLVDTSSTADLLSDLKSLRLNIDVINGKNFAVRNKQFLPLKVELSGSLNLTKEAGQKVRLTGKLKTVDGFVKPLGKHFQLIGGSLTYSGAVDNPGVYLRSVYEPHRTEQDVKIWHIIEGTIQNPAFKFKSTPYMELQNIISYTLFGQPFYQLGSIEQNLVNSVVSQSTADRTAEVLINRAEILATQKLSVDVVRIDNTTAESGTVITTGWYINPRVFFAIQNVIAGRPRVGFYLEYYLTENLKLLLSQDDDYGQGIDLQYEYDY